MKIDSVKYIRAYWNNDKSLSINRDRMKIKRVYSLKGKSLRCLNALFPFFYNTLNIVTDGMINVLLIMI